MFLQPIVRLGEPQAIRNLVVCRQVKFAPSPSRRARAAPGARPEAASRRGPGGDDRRAGRDLHQRR
jgi:hypothetical protein